MQGLVVVGLIFEEIHRSRSPGHGTCQVSTSRRSLYKVWWLKALQLRTYGRVT